MCELWIGDRWPNLNCFTAKSNRSGAPCLGQECAAMMQEVLSRATSRMFITSCQMTLKTSMIWTYTHFTFVYIIHTLYVFISVYIYRKQTTNAGLSLEGIRLWTSFVDNKKPTKVQTQEAHAAFGRPRLCFQAFTSKDLFNKRWLKRAPSQPFGFSGSHIFLRIISKFKHQVQEGSAKSLFWKHLGNLNSSFLLAGESCWMDRCWRGRTFEYWFSGPTSHTGRIPRGREEIFWSNLLYFVRHPRSSVSSRTFNRHFAWWCIEVCVYKSFRQVVTLDMDGI